ncbi:MAG TPA: Rne/Rng family ribonuclease [Deltaproteobacteria bacterium]|nr:Rne/Rng family ribonuclease [Deltaproteobacteria bacterium]
MKKPKIEMLVNSCPFETRLAVLEDKRLVEFYVERKKDRGITGNIYKGKVVRVLPGMQAAFVEIGLERTAFLHVSDIKSFFDDIEEVEGEGERARGGSQGAPTRIQDVLKEGQEVMVQVAKEPMGTKGARVTSYVSLPGRYLVLMPTYDRLGVSRRIADDKERRRLREIVASMRPKGMGFIIRTVCEGMRKADVKADMDYLLKLWKGITRKMQRGPNPSILYEELDLTLRTVRDSFSANVSRFLIDDRAEYERAARFIAEFMPNLKGRIELYEGKDSIFDAFGIEIELENALNKRVWLRSGGHIVIDQMEALTAIDVNTGKYVGRRNSEETIVKTNLEAVREIVTQLRLRNIGGIIVIDFIDMAKQSDRERVYNLLKELLKADKARSNILKISELGIVEMTRKRVRESLGQSLCEPCPYCDGNGIIKGKETVVMEIYRDLLKELPAKRRKAVVYANPAVAERLLGDEAVIGELEERFGKRVVVKSVDLFHREQYEII